MRHLTTKFYNKTIILTLSILIPSLVTSTQLFTSGSKALPWTQAISVFDIIGSAQASEPITQPISALTASPEAIKTPTPPTVAKTSSSKISIKKTPITATKTTTDKKLKQKKAPQKSLTPKPTVSKAAPTLALPKPASVKTLTQAELKLLEHARETYWRRDVATSIADYKKLLHEVPNHPGIYGELGNVYYMTGQYAAAGRAYASAAHAMIRLHRNAQAQSLLPLIGSLNPQEAAIIAHTLEQSKHAQIKKKM